jgi:hypothetical protein
MSTRDHAEEFKYSQEESFEARMKRRKQEEQKERARGN